MIIKIILTICLSAMFFVGLMFIGKWHPEKPQEYTKETHSSKPDDSTGIGMWVYSLRDDDGDNPNLREIFLITESGKEWKAEWKEVENDK